MKKDIHNFTLDYFIKHQKKLVKKYKGKELLMDSSGVVAAFDTLREAYTATFLQAYTRV